MIYRGYCSNFMKLFVWCFRAYISMVELEEYVIKWSTEWGYKKEFNLINSENQDGFVFIRYPGIKNGFWLPLWYLQTLLNQPNEWFFLYFNTLQYFISLCFSIEYLLLMITQDRMREIELSSYTSCKYIK